MKKIFPNIKYKKPPPIQEKILKDLLREVGIIIPRDFWGLLRSLQHVIPDESTTIQKQKKSESYMSWQEFEGFLYKFFEKKGIK